MIAINESDDGEKMQIQINTDSSVEAHEKYSAQVKSVIENSLSHFSDQITRIEVHLSDVNGDKGGAEDKRCMIEARLEGRRPLAVTHEAPTLDMAIDGAANKMKRSIESDLGRLHDKR